MLTLGLVLAFWKGFAPPDLPKPSAAGPHPTEHVRPKENHADPDPTPEEPVPTPIAPAFDFSQTNPTNQPAMKLIPSSIHHRLPLVSLPALGLCAFLSFGGVSAADAQLKVGIVDMNKVFSGYYKTKEAENKINDAREGAKKELDERMESHKQMLDEINTLNKDIDNAALSEAAKKDRNKKRDDKIQQVRALEQEINDFKTSRERGLQEQAVRMRNQIVEEIMTIINARVKSDSFDLVLDKSGQSLNGVNLVLHSNEKMEFSDDVISALNKNRPAPDAAAAAAATPAKPAATATPRR